MQLIRPCLIASKGLMRRSKPGAVGDAANAGSDKLDAAGVIGSRCKALARATDPGGRLARPGVVSRIMRSSIAMACRFNSR